jgi:hypothetical protein
LGITDVLYDHVCLWVCVSSRNVLKSYMHRTVNTKLTYSGLIVKPYMYILIIWFSVEDLMM